MSIARTPKTKTATAGKFIRGDSAKPPTYDRVPISINFDRAVLDGINTEAEYMGITRTAFITMTMTEKLRALEQARLFVANVENFQQKKIAKNK